MLTWLDAWSSSPWTSWDLGEVTAHAVAMRADSTINFNMTHRRGAAQLCTAYDTKQKGLTLLFIIKIRCPLGRARSRAPLPQEVWLCLFCLGAQDSKVPRTEQFSLSMYLVDLADIWHPLSFLNLTHFHFLLTSTAFQIFLQFVQ